MQIEPATRRKPNFVLRLFEASSFLCRSWALDKCPGIRDACVGACCIEDAPLENKLMFDGVSVFCLRLDLTLLSSPVNVVFFGRSGEFAEQLRRLRSSWKRFQGDFR